jgi:hypothetical protein
MGILEKIAEIEAEMARTQRNKVSMDFMLRALLQHDKQRAGMIYHAAA